MATEGGSASSRTRPLLTGDGVVLDSGRQRKALDKLTPVVVLSMGIVFVFCMDRSNVGLAASDLCKDLKLSHSQYGMAIGLFSVGSVSTQVLSNVMLKKFGAPIWLSFITLAWGCVSTASAFVHSHWQYYLTRVLLGMTEGGSFPGVFYYLSLFFPETHIEEAYGSVQAATYLAVPVSIPFAAGLLSTDGMLGTVGWRNLFFVEGLIPVVLSVVLFFALPKSAEALTRLDPEERRWLMQQNTHQSEDVSLARLLKEIVDISKLLSFWLIVIVWGIAIAYYIVLTNWITLMIHDDLSGTDDDKKEMDTCGLEGSSVTAVVLTAIPYLLSGLVCFFIRTKTSLIRNRSTFTAAVVTLCACLSMSWTWTRTLSFAFGFLSLAASVAVSGVPNMFACGIGLTLLRSDLRATGMALGNCVASIACIVLPMIIGNVIDAYGYGNAMFVISGTLMAAAAVCCLVRDPLTTRRHL